MAAIYRRARNMREILSPMERARHITKASMHVFLQDMRSDASSFVAAAEFSDIRPYGRRLLLQTSTAEALVMGFHPSHECPPHDHGGSDGLVLVCSGFAEHCIYRREGSKLTFVECTIGPAGSIIEAPIKCVHSMGNPGPEPLVTLHLYWPPIRHMTVFDLQNRKVYEVNGTAGAWLPIAPETLISCTDLE